MGLFQKLLAGATLCLINAQLVLCSPNPKAIEERATCNADNVLRAFRASQNFVAAVSFCSQYISLPPVTTTTVQVSA